MRVNVRHLKSAPWQGKFEVGMHCLVPPEAFCEYQGGPSPKAKRVVRTTGRQAILLRRNVDRVASTRGTKKNPVIGKHGLFTILTTSPNEIVKPVPSKSDAGGLVAASP